MTDMIRHILLLGLFPIFMGWFGPKMVKAFFCWKDGHFWILGPSSNRPWCAMCGKKLPMEPSDD